MNSKTVALAIILGLTFLSGAGVPVIFVDAALAQRIPGVAVGQWIKYGKFLSLWDSEVPGASPTSDLLDVNSTDWVINTIRNVSGPVVGFDVLTRYKNGAEIPTTASVNVDTGTGKGNVTFVAAGISTGDHVYSSGELYAVRVNSTSLRSYANVFRETSLLNVTQVSIGFNTSSAYWSEYFWDKLTGVLMKQFYSVAHINEDGYLTLASVEYEMIDTNIWLGVPDAVMPVANAGPDVTVEAGANVTFDGGGSRDNVGITSFMWNFGDGSSGSGLTVFHIFNGVGAYNVTLTVKDVGGHSASDLLVVTVEEASGGSSPSWLLSIGVIALLFVLVLAWFLLRRR